MKRTDSPFCWIAARASGAWDFVDKRQVIRRLAFIWMLYLTGLLVKWTMDYAWQSNQDGLHIAAVIAAVWTPWTALQGAIFKFYDQAQIHGGIERSAKQRADA